MIRRKVSRRYHDDGSYPLVLRLCNDRKFKIKHEHSFSRIRSGDRNAFRRQRRHLQWRVSETRSEDAEIFLKSVWFNKLICELFCSTFFLASHKLTAVDECELWMLDFQSAHQTPPIKLKLLFFPHKYYPTSIEICETCELLNPRTLEALFFLAEV